MSRMAFTDLTRLPDADLPRVDVVISNSRGEDHAWVAQAIQSVKDQSYWNTGLIVVDNLDHSLSLGEAWNIGIEASEAPLLFFLREEDAITADLLDCMITFYVLGKRENPALAHVTTFITIMDDRSGATALAQLPQTGMFERSAFQAERFDTHLVQGIERDFLRRVQEHAHGKSLTLGLAHHYGYLFRNHAFRVDGIRTA
jgi:hypothetical protein